MSQTYPINPKVKYLTGTKKKKFFLSKGLTPSLLHSYWDGGSKNVYSVVNIHTGRQTLPPTWGGNFDAQGKREYVPVAGDILIETGCFCGKPATPYLSFREEDEATVKQFLGIV